MQVYGAATVKHNEPGEGCTLAVPRGQARSEVLRSRSSRHKYFILSMICDGVARADRRSRTRWTSAR